MKNVNSYLDLFEHLLSLNPSVDIQGEELKACASEIEADDDRESQLLSAAMAGYMFGVAVGATEVTRRVRA